MDDVSVVKVVSIFWMRLSICSSCNFEVVIILEVSALIESLIICSLMLLICVAAEVDRVSGFFFCMGGNLVSLKSSARAEIGLGGLHAVHWIVMKAGVSFMRAARR